jgi:hypothetical protein
MKEFLQAVPDAPESGNRTVAAEALAACPFSSAYESATEYFRRAEQSQQASIRVRFGFLPFSLTRRVQLVSERQAAVERVDHSSWERSKRVKKADRRKGGLRTSRALAADGPDKAASLQDAMPESDPAYPILSAILDIVPASHWSFARVDAKGALDSLYGSRGSGRGLSGLADEFKTPAPEIACGSADRRNARTARRFRKRHNARPC